MQIYQMMYANLKKEAKFMQKYKANMHAFYFS